MASIEKDAQGFRVRFQDLQKRRQTIRLSGLNEKQANQVARHIEEILNWRRARIELCQVDWRRSFETRGLSADSVGEFGRGQQGTRSPMGGRSQPDDGRSRMPADRYLPGLWIRAGNGPGALRGMRRASGRRHQGRSADTAVKVVKMSGR